MATGSVPSEIIERERKKLLEILQEDPDSILDTLTSRRLISEEEYETLENITDPLKKIRKLLILVQKKGEVSCQHFLKCLCSTFPESATIWGLRQEFLQHENIEPPQSMGVGKNPEGLFFPGEKQPEDSEITGSFKDTEHFDLGTSNTFVDEKTSYRDTAWTSWENEKYECNTSKVTSPHSVETIDYDVPEIIDYLQDGQTYEEPDNSLYLGEEEYLELVVDSEDADTTVEEEDYNDPKHLVYDGEEGSEYAESTAFSDEELSYEDSETGLSLEEEEAEEKSTEERKKVFKDVLSCLNMDRSRKLLPDFVKQFSLDRGCKWTPETPGDLAWNFLMKVQALDVTARDSILRHKVLCEDSQGELPTGAENLEVRDIQTINPLDVLCASMLCSDSSLQRKVMSSMYQCKFALPLLLPDAENNKSILMLGAMKDIVKKQSAQSSGAPTGETEKFLTLMKMPLISFVRLGDCSFSKSRILNTLLCPAQLKSHKIFLHQDWPVLVLPRQISDGLVEITWCFPDSDGLTENSSFFQKPVAVANLRGELESFWTEFGFLMEVSSAVFFFTNCLGEKEWDLLMFLGEAAIERCYFVLNPQARESEEAQIFQRILNLKPSQLLFWEEEEAGEKGKNMKGLQAALQEVMSSSVRCVSVEDMASLARELGIQVDQDFENVQGIQVSSSENLVGTVEEERQQRHTQPKRSSECPAEMPVTEPGAGCEVSQILQNFHLTPVSMPHLQNPCPLPIRIGGNLNHASLKAPWIMGPHFWSEQKSKWFRPSPFQNSRFHYRGKRFGMQYSQPQRFYSGNRFMKFSRPPRGRHMNGTFVRPPRPIHQYVQAWPQGPQTMGARERSAALVSRVGHLQSQGSQLGGPVRKPQPRPAQHPRPAQQPRPAHASGTQRTEVTGKHTKTTLHTANPHPKAFQPAGLKQNLIRPDCQQGLKPETQHGLSNPAFQMGSHTMSSSKLSPSSQFQSSQPKPPQPKPFHPMPSQLKPTQTKPTQPQPSQAKCSPSKPTQPQPCQPQSFQCKPSRPRPTQPKSSQTGPSQAKAHYPRPGPKKVGKH